MKQICNLLMDESCLRKTADLPNPFISQFRILLPFTVENAFRMHLPSVATFLDTVLKVVRRGSQKKVFLRVNAGGVITPMKDMHPFRDGSNEQFPRNTVCVPKLVAKPNLTVATVLVPLPFPAPRFELFHVRPESSLEFLGNLWKGFVSLMCCSRTHWVRASALTHSVPALVLFSLNGRFVQP